MEGEPLRWDNRPPCLWPTTGSSQSIRRASPLPEKGSSKPSNNDSLRRTLTACGISAACPAETAREARASSSGPIKRPVVVPPRSAPEVFFFRGPVLGEPVLREPVLRGPVCCCRAEVCSGCSASWEGTKSTCRVSGWWRLPSWTSSQRGLANQAIVPAAAPTPATSTTRQASQRAQRGWGAELAARAKT